MSKTARNSLKLSFFTIISRVLGLVRDRFQAVFFGTGPVATAWEIAFMLPNMLRNLLAEGVLSQAFIPVYAQELKESEKNAARIAGTLLAFLSMALTALVLLAILIFPFVLPHLTDQSPEEAQLMVTLAQTMFVFILTASLTAILAGIANTHQSFSIPALSPIILNLVFISGFVWLGMQNWTAEENALHLAWVVVAGGFIQLGVQLAYIYMRGWGPLPTFQFRHPALRRVFVLMGPMVLGGSLFQLNQFTDIAIASYFIPTEVGAIPALRFAHRLIQLPTGVIGVALSTAILPAISRAIRIEERSGADELSQALRFAFFLTVPAAIGLYLLGPDIIDLIFFGGEWDANSSLVTWLALRFYCIGIPFFSLNKILTSTFYAYQDTKSPLRFMVMTTVLNLACNLTLVHSLQQGGIALSTAISSTAMCSLLYFGVRKKHVREGLGELASFFVRAIPAWALIGLFLFFGLELFRDDLLSIGAQWARDYNDSSSLENISAGTVVFSMILATGLFYFLLCVLFRIDEWKVFISFVRRRAKQ